MKYVALAEKAHKELKVGDQAKRIGSLHKRRIELKVKKAENDIFEAELNLTTMKEDLKTAQGSLESDTTQYINNILEITLNIKKVEDEIVEMKETIEFLNNLLSLFKD